MVLEDLDMVLEWRNHPDIRCYMYSQHEISKAEHLRWYQQNTIKVEKHLLIFEQGNIPAGFINITQLNEGGVADWGFYVAPEAPKGTGYKMGEALMQHAFLTCGFYKMYGQALISNKRSIDLHLRLGFQREGILRDQHFNGKQYESIVCFGLLNDEWQKRDGK